LSSVLQAEGRFREALDYSQKQLAIVQPVVAADPKNLEFRLDVASSQASVGYLLCRSGRCGEGLPQLRKALTEAVDVDRLSNNDETHVNLAVTQVWMAWVLDRNHDSAGALSSYASALAGFKAIGDRDASDANIHLWAAAIQNQIAELHRRLNKTSQAYSEYQEVLGVVGPLASRNIAVLEAQYQLMDTYAGLGDIAVGRSRSLAGFERQQALSQARAWYKRAVDVGNLISNPTAVTPGGFDARSPKQIAASLAQLGPSSEPGAGAKR
jgi:tetratricopeptide (TPR) repeat protein